MSTWLLIDVPNLCWRAFYSTGGIRHKGKATGVLFGVLQEAIQLYQCFNPVGVAWCFDASTSLREERFPWYKEARRKDHAHPEHRHRENEVKQQMVELRTSVLPSLGYSNILRANGFEADDVIAQCCQWVCKQTPPITTPRGIIVSNDKDLHQCLRQGTIDQYIPHTKTLMREGDIVKRYNIYPGQWAEVKAIAGCKTDGITGVFGVGEKVAARYLTGELNSKSSLRRSIEAERELWERNLELTTLPWPGCPMVDLQKDHITTNSWVKVLYKYGMERLLDRLPAEEGAP